MAFTYFVSLAGLAPSISAFLGRLKVKDLDEFLVLMSAVRRLFLMNGRPLSSSTAEADGRM
jgi:hypothetical protein